MNRKNIVISATLGIAIAVLVAVASGLYGTLSQSYRAGASSAPSGTAGSAVSSGARPSSSAVISAGSSAAVTQGASAAESADSARDAPAASPSSENQDAGPVLPSSAGNASAAPQTAPPETGTAASSPEAPAVSSAASPSSAPAPAPSSAAPAASSEMSAASSGPQTAPASENPAASEPENAAPDFTVFDASGSAVKLSDFRGQPVVLNFWASWCYYCKLEMPELNDAYLKYNMKVKFLFVNWTYTNGETQSTAEKYLQGQGYTFPVYYDLQHKASSAYGLTGIPQTFFINSAGSLIDSIPGAVTDSSELDQCIGEILP